MPWELRTPLGREISPKRQTCISPRRKAFLERPSRWGGVGLVVWGGFGWGGVGCGGMEQTEKPTVGIYIVSVVFFMLYSCCIHLASTVVAVVVVVVVTVIDSAV